jgi:phosphohistidine phosphatase
MSDIILWRHADAEPGLPDLQRALTRKGEKQARRVARWLDDRLPPTALVCASPARRAQQTAQALVQLKPREFATVEAFAPSTRLEVALAALRALDRTRTVVVVGHQPTLGELVARLLDADDVDWPIKKGALVWLTEKDTEAGPEVVVRAAISPDLA